MGYQDLLEDITQQQVLRRLQCGASGIHYQFGVLRRFIGCIDAREPLQLARPCPAV
ncbi:hypothetical protein D3C80_2041840 [compost metagenome]